MDEIESLSVAWGGHFGWFNVKLLSCGKSELGDAVIRWMLELLMNAVGAVADFVEHFASALKCLGSSGLSIVCGDLGK